MQLDLEGSVLAGQLAGVVFLGEFNVDVELVARLMADDLLLKAGDEGAAAERQRVVLRLAALERGAVDKALKVDVGNVAVLGRAITGQHAGVAVLHALELGFDLGVVHSLDLFGHV